MHPSHVSKFGQSILVSCRELNAGGGAESRGIRRRRLDGAGFRNPPLGGGRPFADFEARPPRRVGIGRMTGLPLRGGRPLETSESPPAAGGKALEILESLSVSFGQALEIFKSPPAAGGRALENLEPPSSEESGLREIPKRSLRGGRAGENAQILCYREGRGFDIVESPPESYEEASGTFQGLPEFRGEVFRRLGGAIVPRERAFERRARPRTRPSRGPRGLGAARDGCTALLAIALRASAPRLSRACRPARTDAPSRRCRSGADG